MGIRDYCLPFAGIRWHFEEELKAPSVTVDDQLLHIIAFACAVNRIYTIVAVASVQVCNVHQLKCFLWLAKCFHRF